MTTTETFHGREAVVLGAVYFGTRGGEETSFALLDRARLDDPALR